MTGIRQRPVSPTKRASSSPSAPAGAPAHSMLKPIKFTDLRTIWFAGYLSSLFFALIYFYTVITFNWSSAVSQISYRLVLLTSAVSYGISVQKSMQSNTTSLLAANHFHYFAIILIHLFSRRNFFCIVPLAAIEFYHCADHIVNRVYNYPATKAGIESKERHLDGLAGYHTLMERVVVLFEIYTWMYAGVMVLSFSFGRILSFAAETAFLAVRYHLHKNNKASYADLNKFISRQVAGAPDPIRLIWSRVQEVVQMAEQKSGAYLGKKIEKTADNRAPKETSGSRLN